MKASLQMNLSQHLTLTPQLQQAIKLLQLSTLDLSQEIAQAAESNPMLEIEEINQEVSQVSAELKEREAVNSNQELNFRDYAMTTSRQYREDGPNYENTYCAPISLQDHLTWQMELTPFSQTDLLIATSIIDAIDDDGFLTISLEDIQIGVPHADDQSPVELDEIEAVRHRIQRFDPIGCGSRNLRECLLIQLERMAEGSPIVQLTQEIVSKYLDALGQRQYREIMRKAHLDEETLADVIKIIQTLQPKPGLQVTSGKTEYVIPDVIVTKQGDDWKVELNPESLPKVRINNEYANLIRRGTKSEENDYLKQHLQEARWFMKSLHSRHDTLLRVASKIVEYQADFLQHGAAAMKPLVLHTIASDLELHESTISRVTTQKFMHTPQGVFELKYFFSSHVQTASGGECSSTAIRALIKKLIHDENHRKPLSDNKIAQVMAEQGIKVARRTIAKYREALCIPPSHERKSLIE